MSYEGERQIKSLLGAARAPPRQGDPQQPSTDPSDRLEVSNHVEDVSEHSHVSNPVDIVSHYQNAVSDHQDDASHHSGVSEFLEDLAAANVSRSIDFFEDASRSQLLEDNSERIHVSEAVDDVSIEIEDVSEGVENGSQRAEDGSKHGLDAFEPLCDATKVLPREVSSQVPPRQHNVIHNIEVDPTAPSADVVDDQNTTSDANVDCRADEDVSQSPFRLFDIPAPNEIVFNDGRNFLKSVRCPENIDVPGKCRPSAAAGEVWERLLRNQNHQKPPRHKERLPKDHQKENSIRNPQQYQPRDSFQDYLPKDPCEKILFRDPYKDYSLLDLDLERLFGNPDHGHQLDCPSVHGISIEKPLKIDENANLVNAQNVWDFDRHCGSGSEVVDSGSVLNFHESELESKNIGDSFASFGTQSSSSRIWDENFNIEGFRNSLLEDSEGERPSNEGWRAGAEERTIPVSPRAFLPPEECWPPLVTSGRVSVSPAKTIAKIAEHSLEARGSGVWDADFVDGPPQKKEEPKKNPDEDSSCDSDKETPDGPPVYRSTTEPINPRKTRDTLLSTPPKLAATSGSSEPPAPGMWARTRQWAVSHMPSCCSISFTGRQWTVLLVLAVVTFTSSFAVCLFPPFFPQIAETKGANTTIYGLIIGTNCLVAFLVTPSVGKNLESIGVKFSFVMGALAGGCCCILSGFLEWFPPGWEFVGEAVAIRALHAASNAFVITATFAFVVVEFPDHVAKLFAMTRATMNLAQMLGPVVGGALYELGGFKLPFLVLGTVQIVVSLLSCWALPPYRRKQQVGEEGSTRVVTLRQVCAIPGMWVSFSTFVFSTMSNGFLSITLEALVLRKFNMSHVHVGMLFGLKDGANSLASPLWGFLCDHVMPRNINDSHEQNQVEKDTDNNHMDRSLDTNQVNNRTDRTQGNHLNNSHVVHHRAIILVSTALAALSFVLLGPLPGLPLRHTHGLVVSALVINGFGIGGQQVAGVVHAMTMARSGRLPDNAATHGFIAGLWSSLSGGGRFLSRAVSGYLVETIGFRFCCLIVVLLHAVVFVVTSSFMICEPRGLCRGAREEQESPARQSPASGGRDATISVVHTNTPTESMTTKAITMPVPQVVLDYTDCAEYTPARSFISTPP